MNNKLMKEFQATKKRFVEHFSKWYCDVDLTLEEDSKGKYLMDYNLGINYIINSNQNEMQVYFATWRECLEDEICAIEMSLEDCTNNMDNYDMEQHELDSMKDMINFFKLEVLRMVLNENGYKYLEDHEKLLFIMTNHFAYVNKESLNVSDDLTGNSYKDIDDVIKNIENK